MLELLDLSKPGLCLGFFYSSVKRIPIPFKFLQKLPMWNMHNIPEFHLLDTWQPRVHFWPDPELEVRPLQLKQYCGDEDVSNGVPVAGEVLVFGEVPVLQDLQVTSNVVEALLNKDLIGLLAWQGVLIQELRIHVAVPNNSETKLH